MFERGIYNFKLMDQGSETTIGQVEVLQVKMPHLLCRFGGPKNVIVNSTAMTFISATRVGDLPDTEEDEGWDEPMPVILD